MKVVIIGAGVSGLASARHVIKNSLECTVFEMTGSVGGTWFYTENTDIDEFNNPIHSSMYASLRTNLPVQLMEFHGYKFHQVCGSSYPHHEDVLKYLRNFAKDYDLLRYIKFHHKVLNVSKLSDKWSITVQNFKENYRKNYIFDSVIICTGHYSKPYLPDIPGMDTFNGSQIHSHYYRRNTFYKNKTMLIIGSGASGLDIGVDCSQVAKKVFLSCGSKCTKSELADNLEKKGKVSLIAKNKIFFEDNTSVLVDSIIYCTGYLFEYPFLDPTCKIEIVDGKIVQPLFKYFLSIPHPSMCFIGLLQSTVIFPLVDLQAEVFVQILTNHVKVPPREKMLQIWQEENKKKAEMGMSNSHYYHLNLKMRQYLEDIAHFGNVSTYLPPVLYNIYEKNRDTLQNDYKNLKKFLFTVVDDETFSCEVKIECNEKK